MASSIREKRPLATAPKIPEPAADTVHHAFAPVAAAAYRTASFGSDTEPGAIDINQETIESCENVSQEERNAMIEDGIPLVKFIAHRIANRVPSHVDVDDLINSGIMGLIEAADRFEPERNVKFKTYAEQRIRGAIIDNLRGLDWVPRTLRRKQKDIEGAYQALEQRHGRPTTDEEVAEHLGVSLDDLHKSLDELKGVTLGLFTDAGETLDGEGFIAFIPDPDAEDPSIKLHEKEIRDILKKSLKELPEKERRIVEYYYYSELTMKEIGTRFDITESRVSQLHTKAILRLRGKLRNLNVDGR